MLTTIIYRSHLRDDAPLRALEDMVTAANLKNRRSDVTGILLFNGRHFFQLLEGPEEQVKEIYRCICNDPRHHNIVELMCDYAPARRFGKVGMELFDLQKHERNDVLQAVLNKGTSKFQLTYDDRALQFFRTFVLATEKSSYFEIPAPDYWSFIADNSCNLLDESTLPSNIDFSFAFQPIIDPMSQRVIALEALIRGRDGETPATYFDNLNPEELYTADLQSKKTAFAMASALGLNDKMLSVNLLPMTLVNKPDAVSFLINEIAAHGLVPEQIIVEFTESEVISRFDTFAQAVKSLKAAGICVAIDHFGQVLPGFSFCLVFNPTELR